MLPIDFCSASWLNYTMNAEKTKYRPTRMVISYEIYETSLHKLHMTTSVRFCLSFDPLKWNFIALKMNTISKRKCVVDTDFVNDVTCTRVRAKVLLRVWSYNFMARRYLLNNSDVI